MLSDRTKALEHIRAHRSAQENVKQVLSEYYFQKIAKLASEIVAKCKTCAQAKYDRHPISPISGRRNATYRHFLHRQTIFPYVPIFFRTIEDLKPALLH